MPRHTQFGPYHLHNVSIDVLEGRAGLGFSGNGAEGSVHLQRLVIGDVQHLTGEQSEKHALAKAREVLLELAHHIEQHLSRA